MFKHIFENVREKCPTIHNITNYVTANDCANILLACGASPIMADDSNEAADITAICSGLNINTGTLNKDTIEAMLISGKKANELNYPVILDPVGVGASKLRTETVQRLMREIKLSVIKGNISEIKFLADGQGKVNGVDAGEDDKINTSENTIILAKNFAKKFDGVCIITGKTDIVADKNTAYCIYNGHEMMSCVTGTGCQLSALTAAFTAANPTEILKASAAAVCAIGLAGETAKKRLHNQDGNSTYRNYIIDEMFNMTPQMLESGARYDIK